MKTLYVAQDIVSLSDFKVHASRMLHQIQDSHRPMVITQNGRPAGVIISPLEFDRLTETNRFIEAIGKGLSDAVEGRVLTDEELDKALHENSVD